MDEFFMREALAEAQKAYQLGEVPIGAVVVDSNNIIARGYNLRETTGDPTAHAEIIAIRNAAASINHWRLNDFTLYVTIEPCAMCAGALVLARIKRLVYGADDPKAGAVNTLYHIATDKRLNHIIEVTNGIMAADCLQILQKFFQEKRYKREE